MRPISTPILTAGLALAAAVASAQPQPAAPQPGAVVDLASLARGVLHSSLGAAPDPTQTYELYLPTSFDPEKRWPLLLVFDPRSRGKLAAEIFVPAAEELGWIVASSNNTMSDGPWEPNIRAVNAMFPDLMARLPLDPQRVYATGFSGGAMLAWIVGLRTGKLAGVLAVGGRPPEGMESEMVRFATWIAAGRTDFNYRPSGDLDALAAKFGARHRLEYFDGPHAWISAADARPALRWFEVLAMRDGTRSRDDGFLAAELAADLAGAEALEREQRVLEAIRRLQAAIATYDGLADVGEAKRRLQALESGDAARAARKEEKWAERYEEQGLRRLGQVLGALQAEEPPPLPRLRGMLDLKAFLDQRDAGGLRGEAAARVLATIGSQLGFYLTRDLFAAGQYPRAISPLTIASEIQPTNPVLWYNLACAQARAGNAKDALASLARALDHGLPRPDQLETDSDLDSLRDEPGFGALLARVRAPQPTAAQP